MSERDPSPAPAALSVDELRKLVELRDRLALIRARAVAGAYKDAKPSCGHPGGSTHEPC